MKALRILVVEDHADMRTGLGVLFKMLGCHATMTENLAGARKAAGAENFDVILSDINLPDGDGWDLLRELAAAGRRPLTAIAMSGFGSDKDIAASGVAGFMHHLIKPFPPEELKVILELAAAQLSPARLAEVVLPVARKRKVGHAALAGSGAFYCGL